MNREDAKFAYQERREKEEARKKILRARLEAEFNVPEGARYAERLWAMAWNRGHAFGENEVIGEYCELVELIKAVQ